MGRNPRRRPTVYLLKMRNEGVPLEVRLERSGQAWPLPKPSPQFRRRAWLEFQRPSTRSLYLSRSRFGGRAEAPQRLLLAEQLEALEQPG
jgi:hypothetical protein